MNVLNANKDDDLNAKNDDLNDKQDDVLNVGPIICI